MRALGHENVVKVFAVYGVEQRYAIIMEYVGSRNLHHLLVERREKHLSRDLWCVFEREHLMTGVEVVQNIDVEHVQLRED